jgi:hypothetical protein
MLGLRRPIGLTKIGWLDVSQLRHGSFLLD